MKRKIYIAILLGIVAFGAVLFIPKKSQADLTLVSDTLSTSRLSVAARIQTLSGNLFTINPTPTVNFNSTSTANLRSGDDVTINGVVEVIKAISSTAANQFTTVDGAPAGAPGQAIYYISQPKHQINFVTQTSVPDGFFRVLIPASLTTTNTDGFPDPDGFDFNGVTSANASSSATANFSFDNNLIGATASGGTECTAGFHCFEFHYNGTGPAGSAITLWIGNVTKSLVAPAPKSAHDLGIADTYTVRVQQFPNGANPSTATPVDQTNAKIALIESVRVTATVDPSISFRIIGMDNGVTACGTTTSIDTQTSLNAPLSVPFGTLGLNSFETAAHTLIVSTNATNGYIVTAIEDQAMGKDGGATPTIPDTVCNNPGTDCTISSAQSWNVADSAPGFGYSLESVSGSSVEFTHGGVFNARPFANETLLAAPTRIMYSTGVSNNHSANVCYRIAVDATQAAGDYENQVTYTATATF